MIIIAIHFTGPELPLEIGNPKDIERGKLSSLVSNIKKSHLVIIFDYTCKNLYLTQISKITQC